MPWRLILFIAVFAMFLFFIGFNLGDKFKCDINFGFTVLSGVPVFFTIFVSFALGLVCATPLFLHLSKKRKSIPKKGKNKTDDTPSAPLTDAEFDEKIKQDAASARERLFAKREARSSK